MFCKEAEARKEAGAGEGAAQGGKGAFENIV